MPRKQPFYYSALFLIVLLTPFINEPNSSRYLTLFIILFISLSEIINIFYDCNIFFWTVASVADAATVNSKCTKTLLAKGLTTFFINCKQALIKGLLRR